MNLPEDLLNIIKVFNSDDRFLTLLLYGSYAKASNTETSDIDIAFLSTGLGDEDFLELVKKLNLVTKKDIDLLDMDKASPVIAMQILQKHQVLFDKSKDEFSVWQMKTLGKYHDWKITTRDLRANLGKFSVLD